MGYLRGRQAMQGAYLIDVNAMVFGMPRALFPALAVSVFHGGARTLGYLYAAPAAGALIGALTTGWLARVHRQARAVIVSVVIWGAAIVAFGLVHVLWAALVLLAVAGWADVISAVLRLTMVQASASEEFRSRVSAVQIAVVTGGPVWVYLEARAAATLVSTEFLDRVRRPGLHRRGGGAGGPAAGASAATTGGSPATPAPNQLISHPDPGHQG